MLGESNVGKTSLIKGFQSKDFSKYTDATMSCDLTSAKVTMYDGKAVGIHLWDIPGS